MFNQDEWVECWRQSLLAHETVMPEDVDELEDHLRQEVASLTEQGHSREEACQMAAQRLGQVHGLAEEFAKVNNRAVWWQRLHWMFSGLLLIKFWYILWMCLPFPLAYLAASLSASSWLGGGVYGLLLLGYPLGLGLGIGVLLNARRREQWLAPLLRWTRNWRGWAIGVLLLVLVSLFNIFVTRLLMSDQMAFEKAVALKQITTGIDLAMKELIPFFWGGLWLWLNRQQTPAVQYMRWAIAGKALFDVWSSVWILVAHLLGSTAIQFFNSIWIGGTVEGLVILGIPSGVGLAALFLLNTRVEESQRFLQWAKHHQTPIMAGMGLALLLQPWLSMLINMTGVQFYGGDLSATFGQLTDSVDGTVMLVFWVALLTWLKWPQRQRPTRRLAV